MQIITLTEIQFKNYSRMHSKRNYLQSIEFAEMQRRYGYNHLYIGLIDENNNLVAASLILNKKILGNFLYGYVPGGYLIDYTNFNLLKTFTNLLKKYLFKLNYIYVSISPQTPIRITDKNQKIVLENNSTIYNLQETDYQKKKKEINLNSTYLNYNSNNKIMYDNLSRFIKRDLKENKKRGIKIFKGSEKDINTFYNLIKKKTTNNVDYYLNLYKTFDNPNNKFDIYFASINVDTYLKNYNNLLNKEKIINEKLNSKMIDINVRNKEYYLKKKIASDKLIEKYTNELKKAITLNKIYQNEVIIATCAIITTNNEVTFFIDGYEEKTRFIRATYSIKWEIIKQYSKLGYQKFNLGYIPKYEDKYKGLYLSKLGFNTNVYEYPGQYNLVINPILYNLVKFSEAK